jgi:hypothetical protein
VSFGFASELTSMVDRFGLFAAQAVRDNDKDVNGSQYAYSTIRKI